MIAMDTPEAGAEAVFRALGRLRDRHADMTVQQAMAFFLIAFKPGITQRELLVELGSNDSTVSRILAILSDIGYRTAAGLDVIVMRVNPNDRRERLVYLTPKGKRLMADIAGELGISKSTVSAEQH